MRNEPGRYIYGIIRRPPVLGFNFTGIDDKPVKVVPFENLAAIVSESPVKRYEVDRDNTLKHEWVIEQVMEYYTVLPVRFGTVAASEDDVRLKLLRRQFGSLHGMLKRMDNKVELGVKASYNPERIFSTLVEEDSELRLLRDTIARRTDADSRYERIQLGQMVEQALAARRAQDAKQVVEILRPLAVETRENLTQGDMMVINAAFLVDKRRESVFDARVQSLDDEYGGLLDFKYVGPLPPFNFVTLVVNWDDNEPASDAPDWEVLVDREENYV